MVTLEHVMISSEWEKCAEFEAVHENLIRQKVHEWQRVEAKKVNKNVYTLPYSFLNILLLVYISEINTWPWYATMSQEHDGRLSFPKYLDGG